MEHGEQGREEEYGTGMIPKGRRTKRYRSPFPPVVLQENVSCYQDNSFPLPMPMPIIGSSSPVVDSLSPLSSHWSQESSYEHTEEEQAVASYLLLLSNSHESPRHAIPIHEAPSVQFSEAKSKNNTSKWIGPDGQVYYRCTTCGRDFLSFQALGGHRASHKKPKLNQSKNEYNSKTNIHKIRKVVEEEGEDDMLKLSINSSSMAIAKTRIHQCTICGSKFASGQALGGHMRRHRSPTMAIEATSSDEVAPNTDFKEENEIPEENETSPLALDLNLPAPLEEKRAAALSLSPEVDFHF